MLRRLIGDPLCVKKRRVKVMEETASTVKGNKFWESRLGAGLVGAFAVMVVGVISALISHYATIEVGEKEERSRTFDLLSNREVAAQTLQAKVFEIYVEHIVPALEDSGHDHKKVALLAGLHSNFSEFFDTRPVFEAFAEEINDVTARHELTRLAKRVARRQAEYIKAHMDPTNQGTMYAEVTLSWPSNPDTTFPLAIHYVTLEIKGAPTRPHYTIAHADSLTHGKPGLGDADDDLIDDVSDFVTVEVKLTPQETTSKNDTMGPFLFDLSYMDTPYMDNIWMRHGDDSHHQVALRLIDIDTTINIDTKEEEYSVTIEIIHFPGDIYAATQRLPIKEMLQGGHEH